jgi:hypothetical protein
MNFFLKSYFGIRETNCQSRRSQNRDSIRDQVLLIAWDRRGGENRGAKKGGQQQCSLICATTMEGFG